MSARTEAGRSIVAAAGDSRHVIVGLLFPTLPAKLAEQVERERAAWMAEWKATLERTPKADPADIARRVAYIRVRRSK